MDVYSTRKQLLTKRIFDIPLRVTFYSRVSTDSDEQLNSLENQVSYYTDYIKRNKNWTYIEGYVDEGLSGISTRKREKFNQMIDDAFLGKFDLILTKEITRFARNTLDSIKYTRELLNCGVFVFFQNDNINTIDEDSELRLTIMSGIAQDELRKLSSRVRFGHQQAIKSGVVLGNSRMFGYVKENKRLVIDEREAQMVRTVFELYATDEYSMKQIENVLWEQGYRNHNGNKISHTTLSNMIANPKYKGYYVGNKVRITDMFTKKQKFLPQSEWHVFKDETGETVPAIVSEELWEKANAVLSRRSADVKNRQNKCNHANLLTGKIICSHCNKPYYRKDATYRGKNTSRWTCSHKLKNGSDSCPSFTINEAEIKDIIFDVFTNSYEDAEKYIDEYLSDFKKECYKDCSEDIAKYQAVIENAKKKMDKLLQMNIDGKLSDIDFERMLKKCKREEDDAQAVIDELNNASEKMRDTAKGLRVMKTHLQEAIRTVKDGKEITAPFINKYIDKIVAVPEDDGSLTLYIYLFSNEVLQKSLVRTGHTFLTIWPPTLPACLEVRSPL